MGTRWLLVLQGRIQQGISFCRFWTGVCLGSPGLQRCLEWLFSFGTRRWLLSRSKASFRIELTGRIWRTRLWKLETLCTLDRIASRYFGIGLLETNSAAWLAVSRLLFRLSSGFYLAALPWFRCFELVGRWVRHRRSLPFSLGAVRARASPDRQSYRWSRLGWSQLPLARCDRPS